MSKQIFFLLFSTLLLVTGCNETSVPLATVAAETAVLSTPIVETTPLTPEKPPQTPIRPAGVLISEVLPGIPGDNNREFIELYNPGVEPVNLAGWSLYFRLTDDKDEELVYTWGRFDVRRWAIIYCCGRAKHLT